MADSKSTQQLLEMLQAGRDKDPRDINPELIRYALYARKSTTSEDRQASSIEDQVKECMEKVVTPNNLNVVKIYQESYSAKVADLRDEFNSLIKEIESGRIEGVIAWHPDRMSRNMKEAGAIIDLVDRGLIKDLRFATFTFENTPAGKMLLGITFVMAKQYSEHLSESVDRGNKRAIEDAEFIGKFKHGYVVDEKRYFRPDPINFAKIQHMFEMALAGKSQKDIRIWINKQEYTVQKLPGGKYVSHVWDKDDVSKLLRDPHYAGVHKWGKNLTNLVNAYNFEPVVSVNEFLRINKIDDLRDAKILAINRPKGGNIQADLLRGIVYCGKCKKSLTSMLVPKRDKETGEVLHARYYYKCETESCVMRNKSARAGLVVDEAQRFFRQYLFITKNNYQYYLKAAKKEAKRKTAEFDSDIARLKRVIGNKETSYQKIKDLILESPDMKDHYDLGKNKKEITNLKRDYKKAQLLRKQVNDAIPTFEDYLKLLKLTPVILSKIRDMKAMDELLRTFFSNFTITPVQEGTFKGSKVTYKLNEPWDGFVNDDDFVNGAASRTII